jgi:hypothetical protein
MALFFQRDATLRVFPNKADGTFPSGSLAFDIPLLEGFSFSQSTNASEITLSEMESTAGTSRRGRKAFNDSLAPVEWSFSTYLRPYIASNSANPGSGTTYSWGDAKQHLVDEPLWNALLAKSRIEEASSSQSVISVVINAAGTGYTVGDVLTFTGGTLASGGAHATAKVLTLSGSTVATIEIVTGGNYTVAPTGVTDVGSGSGLTLTSATLGESEDAILERTALVLRMDASQSNVSALNTMTLEFLIGTGVVYQLNKAVVNSATVNFDVEGIATVEWSGMAATITNASAFTTTNVARAVNEGGTSADTENFIRNRLTAMSVAPKTGGTSVGVSGMQTSYDVTLTGGSFSIENNLAYLTPEELGVVNKPIEHVTGVRNIGGSFTCYLATSASNNGSKDFYEDLTSTAALDVITHDFDMTFKVGGSSGTPRVEFRMPQSHVEVPSHSIEDVISLESTFTSIQSDLESNTPDDLNIESYGVALA